MKLLYESSRKIAKGEKPSEFAAGRPVQDVQLAMGLIEFDIARRLMGAASDPGAEWRLIRSCLRKRDMRDRLSELFARMDRFSLKD